MLSLPEARERILAAVSPLPTAQVPLLGALGRFAAASVHATVPLPGFDNSSMDGYAVRAADTRQPARRLPVIGEQPAGPSRNLTLVPNAAIRIFTGAPMPAGADAVIMQEDVELDTNPNDPDQRAILCREPVETRENVRIAGCDLCQGQKILSPGERLTAARLSVLASQGLARVEVHAAPRVAVVTTGDELQPPGQSLQSGQIYNSNGIMLQALVKGLTGVESTVAHLPDSLDATESGLSALMATHDFLILSGGVSVGEHDCVKPALHLLGIEPVFWRVKIRPGKPLLFASVPASSTVAGGKPCWLFGLPGNPVSSFITFLLFVRPALLKALGAAESEMDPLTSPVELTAPLSNRSDRPFFMCGRADAGRFAPTGLQQSHALFALSQANAMVCLDPAESLPIGAVISAMFFPGFR